jgi:DNA segregation ATPase FtsK/SpoIIIE-like protein
MMLQRKSALVLLLGLLIASVIIAPATSMADTDDPPTRVARLAYLEGSISFQPGGTNEWVAAPLNRPITTGDKVWSDQDSRAELQLDGSALRLSSNTSVSFLNLGDNVSQIQLSVGSLLVRVRRLDDNETYEIDTPNLAFSVLQPGVYRFTVDESGTTTAITVRSGQGEVTGAGAAYSVYANESDVFSGTDELVENSQPYGPEQDSFDAWSRSRDNRWDSSVSARFVSSDVVGYEDLDGHGAWESTPEYGNVWFPRGVEAGWAPYHDGHWSYIEPWGYTWVDDQQWGFAPFHYGRWISVRGAWGWVPCPPRAYGAVYVRPVYAPALVAWVGVGAGVAWFALGPREVYVPSYPVSRRYVNNINVSNTTVNTTVINNVYNTTIINNKTINVTNVNYVNRSVSGAVAATTSQAFTSAQPVARNPVHFDQHVIVSAPVRAVTPAVVPTKQSVLGGGRSAAARPSAIVQTRTVVARVVPPAPPPAFEQRQEAIRANGGRPLSVGAVQSISAGRPPATVAVKLAPPAMPAVVHPPDRLVPSPSTREPLRPPSATSEGTRPAAMAVHPQELPQTLRPASPSAANTALERQHLQEQQQLHAQQAAERERIQQQQERDHAQLAKQQADVARKQQLEQEQRQQQAQQLAQQRTQELQQQQARQQADEARRQQLEQQQHQQQAQQLAQQRAQELQQQLARQQADEARRQQLEQQHQQQTQQLAQQHAQALQQQQEQQQEQRRQLEAQAQSHNQRAQRPPNQKP